MNGKTPINQSGFSRRTVIKAAALSAGGIIVPALAQDGRNAKPTAIVKTTGGSLRGIMENGANAFFGVPYGEPATGAQRFAAPRPVKPWQGVKDAVQIAHRSPQDVKAGNTFIPEMFALDRAETIGEDCLAINIWTPALNQGKRPVMVWLHGGGFTSGSGGWLLYDGSRLAVNQDVVVVTVNHRLNVFGYLYLAGLGGEEYADSGNAGMLDIIAVLQWVRDNAAAFGGDAGNVTLFGQSGGGAKVTTLLAMEAAKGLFHRAIAMSGAATTGMKPEQATANTEKLLKQLGLQKSQIGKLRELPMDQLVKASVEITGLSTSPVVDGKHLKRDPFLVDAPPFSKDVPLLMGSTEHEMNFWASTPKDPMDAVSLEKRLRETLKRDAAGVAALLATYKKEFGIRSNEEFYQIIISDPFRKSVLDSAGLKAAQGGAPVYMYYFNWQSTVHEGKLRAFHCIDIPFAFDNVDVCASITGAGQDRYELASRLSTAFGNFARTGNPNHAGLPAWPAYDDKTRATMFMNAKPEVVNNPFPQSRKALYG